MDFSKDGKGAGRNMTGIIFVVGFHLLVGYAVVSGLGTRLVAKLAPPVETKIIEEVKPPPPKDLPPPPPPPKTLAPPPPFIPPPEIQVAQPQVQSPISQSTSTAPPVRDIRPVQAPQAPVAEAKPAGPSSVAATINVKDCPVPEYPRQSQRNEETGTVILRFLVGADGRVKDSQIEKSSGFRELDKAARLSIGSCNKFKPGIENGKPVESYARVAYEWKLD
ncbi:MAG TPA: TonB family protein [Burkholderiaceae bacterium]